MRAQQKNLPRSAVLDLRAAFAIVATHAPYDRMERENALVRKFPLPRLKDIADTEALDAYLTLALQEDGAWDDVTSKSVVPPSQRGRARMFTKAPGVFCGGIIAQRVFHLMDPALEVNILAREGQAIAPRDLLMRVEGSLRSILSAERTALNFVQSLSGVATRTRQLVQAIDGAKASILDTRKTTPLWRALERHAVLAGGGRNHRFALDDMVMIKNNHADAVGGVGIAIAKARAHQSDLPLAAEARTLQEAAQAVEAGADVVMLDNMTVARIRKAVAMIGHRAQVEVTGGVTLRNIASLAHTGVDRISVGAVTHSAPALDISLHLEPVAAKST